MEKAGLNENYDVIATIIQQSDPLPPFYEARSKLLLEETCKTKQATTASQAAGTVNNYHGHGNFGRGRGGTSGRGNPGRGSGNGRGNNCGRGNGTNRSFGFQTGARSPYWLAYPPWGWQKIIILRYVLSDETTFPFAQIHTSTPHSYTFLDENISPYLTKYFTINNTTSNSHSAQDHTTPPSSPIGPPTSASISHSIQLDPLSPTSVASPFPPLSFATLSHYRSDSPQSTRPSSHTLSSISQSSLLSSPQPATPRVSRLQRMSQPPLPRTIITRSMHGISKPKVHFSLSTSVVPSLLPKNPKDALADPN
ncbi:hypothetical protein Tco_0393266 [Tanacetum coccineum]